MKKSANLSGDYPIISESLKGMALLTERRCSLDDFLDFHLSNQSLRKIMSHLFLNYFRHKHSIDDFLQKNLRKSNKSIIEFLSIAITHVKFQNGIAPQSSINAWVEFSKKKFSFAFSKLVNAVLRKALNSEELNQVALPEFVREKWGKIFGANFVEEMTLLYGEYAPFTFRSALNFELPSEFLQQVGAEKLEFEGNIFSFYRAENIAEILQSSYLKNGQIYIQDCATGFAVSLLKLHEVKSKNMIDLCGAPGGKAIMASEIFDHKLEMTILDKSSKRQKLTEENLRNRNLTAKILTADAAKYNCNEKFDLIIADVPCSNSGVFRKRPDALWNLSCASIADVAKIQKGILRNAATLCADNGVILYSTCSIDPTENREQIDKFLAENRNFKLLEEKLHLPHKFADGAYSALLQKI